VDAQETPAPVPAEPTVPAAPSIRDALLGRSDQVSGIAEGGFGGGDTLDITLTLQNLTDAPLEVVVPRGSLFEPEEESQQTAVAAGPVGEDPALVEVGVDPTVVLEPGENAVELVGFCAQHLDSGPDQVVPLEWAGVAEAPLTTVLGNIAAQQPTDEAGQHAVWWVTDVPVVPVPAEVDPLLEGVDAEAFAANPTRVVADERYTPAWGRDQAIDPEDPFGQAPFDLGGDPDTDPFAADDDSGGGGGVGLGFFVLGAVLACLAITVLVARSAGRRTPQLAEVSTRTSGATPAGWYPDPGRAGHVAYWDGAAWTGDSRPG
jgi:hypothetical protein